MRLEAQIARWSDKTKKRVTKIYNASVHELGGRIIYATPVLTGALVGDWKGSYNYPLAYDSKILDPERATTASKFRAFKMIDFADTTICMSNSKDYARKIEYDGHSKIKAPEGMLRINAADWIGIVEDAADE